MTEPKSIKKSLTLSPKLFNDVNALAEHMGINSHSYIVNELAKAVLRDMSLLNVSLNAQSQLDAVVKMFESQIKENPED